MTDNNHSLYSPFSFPFNQRPGYTRQLGKLYGSSFGLIISEAVRQHTGMVVVLCADSQSANRMVEELNFFLDDQKDLIALFPSWETLPYDHFSPYQDIISERLQTLYQLPDKNRGVVVIPVDTAMHRLPPQHYIQSHSLILKCGDLFDLEKMRLQMDQSGYRYVSQVMEHGEYTVRGSIMDIFPSGCRHPLRIELFDDEIESIRNFDPETQRSIDKIDEINLLPAKEYPLDENSIKLFRQQFRDNFAGDPQKIPLYRDISNAISPPGIEYYIPLFFKQMETLFSYLPDDCQLFTVGDIEHSATTFHTEALERYSLAQYETERPPLKPNTLFLGIEELFAGIKQFPRHQLNHYEQVNGDNFTCESPPSLTLDARHHKPGARLEQFLKEFRGRTLFVAESPGRREVMMQMLKDHHLTPHPVEGWSDFIFGDQQLAITIAQLEEGLRLHNPEITVITEPQLYGHQVMQRRRRKKRNRDTDAIIRNLIELQIGSPVVHEDHGVGRYLGLQKLNIGAGESEFLTLEYAGGDKLYVPVTSLDLISRYTGASPEQTPLHRLGSGQWEKAKRKAREKVRDVAAELLEIYAKREARRGHAYPLDHEHYATFASGFPFEETPDQEEAIKDVIHDMCREQPMDRLICGDVGFGKTEVAMRAAYIAVMAGKQVSVLVPTTLLCEQHLQNFRDRFADWPVRIEALSRFRSKKETESVVKAVADGKVDIVIGTHKLIQEGIKFANLGLVVIDEEHRFGVRQKEKFKALRSEVDILTLTATPIPRTLNLALGGMRELSIISSPPARRLAIKTFVHEWSNGLIKEACLREIKRGGQVYFLHNDVETIDKMARELEQLIPEAVIEIAHGQMRERQLEQVMSDFYHQRFNILVCSTIIETGIDVPTANTIIMNRADKLGLAQLYQLRGRVGRSHHRAYAYLTVPSKRAITADARKRLEAIESIEELGTGFTLATHDLEIRGAGEILGDEQSGQLQEIGFTLYTEMLERTVKALKDGIDLSTQSEPQHATEIEIGVPALLPDDYIPDTHSRLILYKRIANAKNDTELTELKVEIIDRFGDLPLPTQTLLKMMRLKLKAAPLGIQKLEFGEAFGRVTFSETPTFDPMIIINLIQKQSHKYQLDNKQRLKIIKKMEDADARLETIEEVLMIFKG